MFAEMCAEAGLPPGVFNLVCGTGPEVGEAIASHPLVDMVSLTGSVRAGRRVMEVAAASIKRVHLELGGKSANIILADADFERAVVDGIEDAMRNTGQVCGGLTRMLVPRQRLKEAEALAVRKARKLRARRPLRSGDDAGASGDGRGPRSRARLHPIRTGGRRADADRRPRGAARPEPRLITCGRRSSPATTPAASRARRSSAPSS